MRQTEIDYMVLPNGTVEFVAFRHVADQHSIMVELQLEKARNYYGGRSYYSLKTIGELNTVRIQNPHEPLHARDGTGQSGYKDFKVGKTYDTVEWDFFLKFLMSAGERYTKIHHAKKKPLFPIKTVRI